MNGTWKTVVITALCAIASAQGLAQVAPATILEVDLENYVNYVADVADHSKLATDPTVTTPVPARNFSRSLLIADIVAVNGKPAKGTFTLQLQTIKTHTSPQSWGGNR